ncbi:MAG: hypothetical protein ABI564_06350, partial [Ideonella sp.]
MKALESYTRTASADLHIRCRRAEHCKVRLPERRQQEVFIPRFKEIKSRTCRHLVFVLLTCALGLV